MSTAVSQIDLTGVPMVVLSLSELGKQGEQQVGSYFASKLA